MLLAVSTALLLVATFVWAVSLEKVDLSAVGSVGLISALPPAYFVGVGLLALSFILALRRSEPPRALVSLQLVMLVMMLIGTPSIVEPLPRFPTSWLHAGFTDYIARTGSTLPSLDARFSWPGFFSGTAVLTRAAGLSSPVVFLRFAPVLFNLLFVLGVGTRSRKA